MYFKFYFQNSGKNGKPQKASHASKTRLTPQKVRRSRNKTEAKQLKSYSQKSNMRESFDTCRKSQDGSNCNTNDADSENVDSNIMGKHQEMAAAGIVPQFISNVHDRFVELEKITVTPLTKLVSADDIERQGPPLVSSDSGLGSLFGNKGRHHGHIGGIWTNIVGTVTDEG